MGGSAAASLPIGGPPRRAHAAQTLRGSAPRRRAGGLNPPPPRLPLIPRHGRAPVQNYSYQVYVDLKDFKVMFGLPSNCGHGEQQGLALPCVGIGPPCHNNTESGMTFGAA
ncbi:unnamed protein product [Gadus morhua 'NCC']